MKNTPDLGRWFDAWLDDKNGWIMAEDPNGGLPIYLFEVVTEDSDGLIASPGQQKAFAKIAADAPETAAERDRLKEVNRELLAAAKKALPHLKRLAERLEETKISPVLASREMDLFEAIEAFKKAEVE